MYFQLAHVTFHFQTLEYQLDPLTLISGLNYDNPHLKCDYKNSWLCQKIIASFALTLQSVVYFKVVCLVAPIYKNNKTK